MKLLACAAALLALTGCASIVNGQNQSISLEARSDSGSAAVGAICRLSNDKGEWFITTPGSTTVRRSYENLGVKCEKDAHEPGLASVKLSTKGMAYGNILFGGIIGAGVDISTGAAYDYPPLIMVVMGKAGDGIPLDAKVPTSAPTPQEQAEKNLAARKSAAATTGLAHAPEPLQTGAAASVTPVPPNPMTSAPTASK